jgi:two-component system, chemotaxis family, sensor kinase CheA
MTMELKNKTVLIVDDDDRNIFALTNYLEILDMNVLTAGNGEEAIELLRLESNIEIILLDMMMPVMDGFDTLKVLRTNDKLRKIPVIAVTARAMKGDQEKCLAAGASDYISKPIDLKIFVEKMMYWLQPEMP